MRIAALYKEVMEIVKSIFIQAHHDDAGINHYQYSCAAPSS